MWDLIFDHQDALALSARGPRGEKVGLREYEMRLQFFGVLSRKHFAMRPLQLQRRAYLLATAELVVENDCFGFIDHAIAGLPQTHAVVGFFVVRRHERFVESPELPEKLAAGKQKSS